MMYRLATTDVKINNCLFVAERRGFIREVLRRLAEVLDVPDDVQMLSLTELTVAWVYGWTISRGTPPPVAVVGGVRVDGGQPGNPTRYVLHAYDRRRLALLGRDLIAPGAEIKILGNTAALRAALPEDWSMYEPCHLMTVAFTHSRAEVPVPYAARIVVDGAALVGLIFDGNSEVASSAQLAPSGRYGVIDRVWTRPPDQRRGLGTALMAMLGNRALDAGLTTGLLSATADGRALYSALGWTVCGELAGAFRS